MRDEQRKRVRPWREGDPPACMFATYPRTVAPECGPPVAHVTVTYHVVQGVGRPIATRMRSYAVCEVHRRTLYDGVNVEARRRAAEMYRLGRDAYLRGDLGVDLGVDDDD